MSIASAIARVRAMGDQVFRDNMGGAFRVSSKVSRPAPARVIAEAWPGRTLPADLVALWRCCRRARLFVDVDYGQCGIVIYSPIASARRTRLISDFTGVRPDDVAVGEVRGTSDLVLLSPSERRRRVLIHRFLDPRADWPRVGTDLGAFLDAYVDALGAEFWNPSVPPPPANEGEAVPIGDAAGNTHVARAKDMWRVYYFDEHFLVPAMALTTDWALLDVEPVASIPRSDEAALRSAIRASMARGNPLVPRPATEVPLHELVGVKSRQTFEKRFVCWRVCRAGDDYIVYTPGRRRSDPGTAAWVSKRLGTDGVTDLILSQLNQRTDLRSRDTLAGRGAGHPT